MFASTQSRNSSNSEKDQSPWFIKCNLLLQINIVACLESSTILQHNIKMNNFLILYKFTVSLTNDQKHILSVGKAQNAAMISNKALNQFFVINFLRFSRSLANRPGSGPLFNVKIVLAVPTSPFENIFTSFVCT